MAGETNQGANNAPGGGGAPSGGSQGSQQSTQAQGSSADGGGADPKAAGGGSAGTHSEQPNTETDDPAKLKAEIASLKAAKEKLAADLKGAVARRKAAAAEVEGAKTEAEKLAEEIKASLEAKHSAETRARDVLDAAIDKNPGANPKLLRMLIKGSGIDLQAEDAKATMEAIDKLLNDEALAPLRAAGVPNVPGSGSGGRTERIGTYHPITGVRLL